MESWSRVTNLGRVSGIFWGEIGLTSVGENHNTGWSKKLKGRRRCLSVGGKSSDKKKVALGGCDLGSGGGFGGGTVIGKTTSFSMRSLSARGTVLMKGGEG